MYWRQLLGAAMLATGAGYLALKSGFSTARTGTAVALTYVTASITIATIQRIRYWLPLGTRGAKTWRCRGCGKRIHRLGGDWILTCRRCGWRPGLPVVRWVTHSVVANQFRRSVSAIHVLAVIVSVALVVGVVPPTLNTGADSAVPSGAGQAATATPTESEDAQAAFIRLLNQERRDRGLQPVSPTPKLAEMGQSHAENMAKHDYLGHEQPDGDTIADRYRDRGLLPECRLPIQGSDRYYPGAENAFYTTEHLTGEAVARAAFRSWMNSPPHRRAMLVYSADEAGLGVAHGNGKTYVALELC